MFTGNPFVHFFQSNPGLAVFLTLAIGFWIGKFKYKSFSLGTVTSVLLVGVVIGQMKIEIPEPAKSLFFMMFLFAVGYAVGPQFFRGLKKDGLPQVGFAAIVCLLCLASVWVCALVMGYDAAQAAGLLAGSQTMSAALGAATDTVKQIPALKDMDMSVMPVCYAVTYIFGTAGSAWVLSSIGPKLLGGVSRVKEAAKELESKLGNDMSFTPGYSPAARAIVFRAFSADNEWFTNRKTIRDFEHYMQAQGKTIFVERVRQQGIVKEVSSDLVIHRGDEIVISGRRQYVIEEETWIGREIEDDDLTNFAIQTLPVVVRNKTKKHRVIQDLLNEDFMHGVSIHSIRRTNVKIPVLGGNTLDNGDRIELVGLPQDVNRAARELGFSDPATDRTSVTLLGLAICLGGIVFGWMLVTQIGSVPLSLTVSGGVLIAGLIAGWLHSKRPDLGVIPEPSVWLLNNLGLNVFIAIVGISTGPSFVKGFQEVGWSLFLVGAIATSMPLILGVIIGKHLFKFNSALTLGCVAGARTTTAALGAVEETINSDVPAMGYTITYAVGNTLLIIWGVVIVLLMS